VAEGKELWEKRAKKLNLHINEDDLEKLLLQLKYDSRADFYAALGSGTLSPESAGDLITELIQPTAPASKEAPSNLTFEQYTDTARDNTNGVYIIGQNIPSAKILFSYARCCNPVPGDDVVGIVTIGSGIKVHRATCHNVIDLHDKLKPRLVALDWAKSQRSEFLAAVKITGDDRPGMLNDITSAVMSISKTNIRGVNIDAYDSIFEGILTVYVTDLDHLKKIFEKLHKIKGVQTVERFEA
jgi:(p)ppGpp synthase/HD superfamily hydrolase